MRKPHKGRMTGLIAAAAAMLLIVLPLQAQTIELLNVSYDPTRELFKEYNEAFAKHWREKTGVTVSVKQSHGGSGSQARAVIDGLRADVVTLALAHDIDAIAAQGQLLPTDWRSRLPRNSAPYTSTLVFLVRKGNPKKISDWADLVRPDVQVITPNPKTSGVARWNYLAIWGAVLHRELGSECDTIISEPKHAERVAQAQAKAFEFVTRVYQNVPVLDRGARGATNTFIQRKLGDVLVTWENEALLGRAEFDAEGVEIVYPSLSIKAEPVVAVVDKNVDQKGAEHRRAAEEYLRFLYSPVGQEIAARNFYRPTEPDVSARHRESFPAIRLFTIDAVFGGWTKAHEAHFADGASFDQVFKKK